MLSSSPKLSKFLVGLCCATIALHPLSAQKAESKTSQNSTSKANTSSKKLTEKPIPTEVPKSTSSSGSKEKPAVVSTISTDQIEGFESYEPQLKALIEQALLLTKQNLTYRFGSSDPKNGGMDCSGTMYYLLKTHGGFSDVPRQSDQICEWSMAHSVLYRTEKVHKHSDPLLSALKPGDLLYWSGTYTPAQKRNTPITHVMMYLGKLKGTGKQVVFGASDGRVYQGKSQNGVSIFDLSLPRPESQAEFYGYAPLPKRKL